MFGGGGEKTIEVGGRPMPVPSPVVIHRVLGPFGPAVGAIETEQIRRYIALLKLWNEKVSLTAITNDEELLTRQFGEALFAISTFAVEKSRLADVGSGAGFPGLALKIFSPSLEVTLIEQNAKKSTFLREAVRFLGLNQVFVESRDFHAVKAPASGFDCITAKALGSYPDLLSFARCSLSSRGFVLLWLGNEEASRLACLKDWNWQPSVAIPDSRRRVILAGSPQKS